MATVIPNLIRTMGIEPGVDLTRLKDLSFLVDEPGNVPHDIFAPNLDVAACMHMRCRKWRVAMSRLIQLWWAMSGWSRFLGVRAD